MHTDELVNVHERETKIGCLTNPTIGHTVDGTVCMDEDPVGSLSHNGGPERLKGDTTSKDTYGVGGAGGFDGAADGND